ncbi:MAG: Uma2 family endonuclease [Planctomycetes bacterium]|nr:Uma2 family endonuclease [Planctomycetota bacterium]
MSINTLVTAEELLAMPDDGFHYELVEGEIRKMSPAGIVHGLVAGQLDRLLGQHVFLNKLGATLTAEPSFRLSRDPDTVRVPDIAFIRRDRLRRRDPREACWPGAPDLAVEVLSPSDTPSEVDEKVAVWLDAGAAMVWVVNPTARSVTIYRTPTDIHTLTQQDELDGQDVVPGFRCRVSEIFASL